jgi:hypothetical protein
VAAIPLGIGLHPWRSGEARFRIRDRSMMVEGRGFLVCTAADTPWSGWLGLRALDLKMSLRTAPWLALGALAEVCEALPGGLALLWDAPSTWLMEQPAEHRSAFLGLLARLPGLSLHVQDGDMFQDLDGPLRVWLHTPEPPVGQLGHAWRQGWLGWVPQEGAQWRIPGFGDTDSPDGEAESGALWGEVILPVGALAHLDPEELVRVLAEAQGRMERTLSQRLGVGAWPSAFPFHRRRTGWRIAILGGREYTSSSGTWEDAARHLNTILDVLGSQLLCPLHVGVSDSIQAASLLGHQAMREGLPWRNSLPLPPASPLFSTGLGADPREASPLELRAFVPAVLDSVLTHPPAAMLRIPSIPTEAAVGAFVRGLASIPAIRWLPISLVPPGPFSSERPWAQSSAYPPVADVTSALQPSLFEGPEWS